MRTSFGSGALLKVLPVAALAAVMVAGSYVWRSAGAQGSRHQFVSGTGHIEGTEITVATRLAGRVENIFVTEGQFVRAGQVLARMQVRSLLAERDEAYARYRQAQYLAAAADVELLFRTTETTAAQAARQQRDGEFASVVQSLARAMTSAQQDPSREQELEEHRAAARRAAAAASAADAQWASASVAVALARVQLASARSAVVAAEATIRRVETELSDTELEAPRDAIVQDRFAQTGAALTAGGQLLNLVDPADVNLTFLLPDAVCGGVALGSEARIVLDTAPQAVIPATISSVSRSRRLTPRIDSSRARENPMCRVIAHIDRDLVQHRFEDLHTGAPGVGWVKLDPHIPWPPALRVS